ncbi:MAG TPA: hypothetical protein VIA09_02880 [Nitrososphaeraceae archaeon]
MEIDRGTILGFVVTGISGAITEQLWHDVIGVLLNTFTLQNIPVNELKGQIGILFFVLTLLSVGILIGKFTHKRKIRDLTGFHYEQLACPKCSHPQKVYPPTIEYKQVVFSKCKEKGVLQEKHNVKGWSKCPNCHKKFDFYWCRGHPFIVSKGNKKPPDDDDGYIAGIDNKGYKSKLDPKLKDIHDQP